MFQTEIPIVAFHYTYINANQFWNMFRGLDVAWDNGEFQHIVRAEADRCTAEEIPWKDVWGDVITEIMEIEDFEVISRQTTLYITLRYTEEAMLHAILRWG